VGIVSVFLMVFFDRLCLKYVAKTCQYIGNLNLFFMTLSHIIFFSFEKEHHDLNIRLLHLEKHNLNDFRANIITEQSINFYNNMWTLTIAISSFRLHYSWKYRAVAVLADLIVPKIYLSIKDGFYLTDIKLTVGITCVYILMCMLLIVNFRNSEVQNRLIS
jgi:hypothetical protein